MENKEVTTIKVYRSLILTLIVLPLFSCAAISSLEDIFIKSIRKPGEKQVRNEDKTSIKYGCSEKNAGELFIEEVEIFPEKLKRGEEVNQRLKYATCPLLNNEPIKGWIKRVVKHDGVILFEDFTKYDFKPGTWNIDIFILVPEESSAGEYEIISNIHYGKKNITEVSTFTVKP